MSIHLRVDVPTIGLKVDVPYLKLRVKVPTINLRVTQDAPDSPPPPEGAWQAIFDLATTGGWTADYLSSSMRPGYHTLIDDAGTERFSSILDGLESFGAITDAGIYGLPARDPLAFGEIDGMVSGSALSGGTLANASISLPIPFAFTFLVNFQAGEYGFGGGAVVANAALTASYATIFAASFTQMTAGAINVMDAALVGPHVVTLVVGVGTASFRVDGSDFITGTGVTTGVPTQIFSGQMEGQWSAPVVRSDNDLSAIQAMENLLMTLSGITV